MAVYCGLEVKNVLLQGRTRAFAVAVIAAVCCCVVV